MTSREKFEAWVKFHLDDKFTEVPLYRGNGGLNYLDSQVDLAWIAWQAAETDMEVQLANAESKCRELAAENAGLKASIPPLKIINDVTDSWDDVSLAEEVGFNDAVSTILKSLPETPTTDSFLAEVRAQGVEMAACSLDDVNQFNYANMLDELAKKLRKGAAI